MPALRGRCRRASIAHMRRRLPAAAYGDPAPLARAGLWVRRELVVHGSIPGGHRLQVLAALRRAAEELLDAHAALGAGLQVHRVLGRYAGLKRGHDKDNHMRNILSRIRCRDESHGRGAARDRRPVPGLHIRIQHIPAVAARYSSST